MDSAEPVNVYDAAIERIKWAIKEFPDYYVSFSAGKDSGVLVNLVIDAARELDRLPVKVVFSDLEIIFEETARYAKSIMELPEVEPYWLCFDEIDHNASSVFERFFRTWDASKSDKWVRPMPDMPYVINDQNCPDELKKYVETNNIDQWSIELFGEYLCDKAGVDKICNFIGMRTDESYGRHMAVAAGKHRTKLNPYTYLTKNAAERTWTCLPIFDWSMYDVWAYYGKTGKDYNRVYDAMYRIGVPMSQMRTCYAFGEEQKKSLWYWPIIEPELWDRMVQRVEGANFGKIYNHTNLSRNRVIKPDGITWRQYLDVLMSELPPMTKANFEEKFKIVHQYHQREYGVKMGIPFEVYAQDSRAAAKAKAKETSLPIKVFFSYESLCGAIIKRDFVFKKYGFGYSKKMQDRILSVSERWQEVL